MIHQNWFDHRPFSATKVRWILNHVDGAQERAEKGELFNYHLVIMEIN